MSKIINIQDAKREDLIYVMRNGIIKFINMTSDPEDQESLQRAFVTLTYALKVASNSMFGNAENALREVLNELLDENSVNNIISYGKGKIEDFEISILTRTAELDPRLNNAFIEFMLPLAYINGGIDHLVEDRLADILGNNIKNYKTLEFLDMREE